MSWTLSEIEKVTQGTIQQGGRELKIKGIAINSKTIRPGEVFIAIQGRRWDGHRFIGEAVRAKAAAVIVSRRKKVPAAVGVIQVKDTTRALGQLARAHRNRFPIPVIAITGTAGKTTSKELIACVLKSKFRVLKNTGTENNHIGVPLTLLRLNKAHQAAVIELGTNQFGDITWLTYVANPTVAVITNVGEGHLEFLKSPAQVFQEKFDLVKGMTKGTVILNRDDRYLAKAVARTGHRTLTFAINQRAHYRASDIVIRNHRTLGFRVNRSHRMSLSTPVWENIYNALTAISCGQLFNLSYNNISKSISRYKFKNGRQAIMKVNGCWLIDDTYNANPVSLKSAMRTLSMLKCRRRILVCADMLELGKSAKHLHDSCGALAADAGVDVLLTYGKMAAHMAKAAQKRNPLLTAYHCPRRSDVHRRLKTLCHKGDTILVKGSRGMQMEKTVRFLIHHLGATKG